jgi:hypothetical protein
VRQQAIAWIGIVVLACGGHSASQIPEPQSPTSALDQFLVAVRTKDYQRISQVWGNENGSAQANGKLRAGYVDSVARVFEIFLRHDGYRIVDGPKSVAGQPNLVTFNVELQMRDCNRVQPFDMVHTRHGGWVVRDPHMEAAAKTIVRCPPLPGNPG